jgi:DNA-binding response OmpR family regulator
VAKVLVVDDDESLRRLMRIELGDTYEIIDSGQPEDALGLALEHKPDAILVDLRMPKYSGFELLQTYTSFSRTQGVPVLVVSGEAGSKTKDHCRKLGAVEYFEKPIDFDELRKCLARIIRKQHQYLLRSDVRLNLSVPLKIRGKDAQGNAVEARTFTDQVSLGGFLCSCEADLPPHSAMDVYIARGCDVQVGKAQVVQVTTKDGSRQYVFEFLEKTENWVLQ